MTTPSTTDNKITQASQRRYKLVDFVSVARPYHTLLIQAHRTRLHQGQPMAILRLVDYLFSDAWPARHEVFEWGAA